VVPAPAAVHDTEVPDDLPCTLPGAVARGSAPGVVGEALGDGAAFAGARECFGF
jgi:hypothetical protein